MWMRIFIYVMVMLALIPLAFAMDECQRIEEPKDIPCTIYSTWKPADCAAFNLTVFNESDNVVQILTWNNLTTVCNATFNITQKGIYLYNSSIESGVIEVEAKDNMIGLGVVIFLLAINIAIFLIPTFVKLHSHEIWHKVISKIIYIFGMGILAFNVSITVTMADNAGLGINRMLFLYQQWILWIIYVSMIFLFFHMIVSTFQSYKISKKKRRMGEE